MARTPAPDTRDRVLDVAARLFYAHGVRAVGLQQVIDETGIGKSSVYRVFASKDDLVVAWLHRSRQAWWTMTAEATSRFNGDPARQLLAIVERVHDEVEADSFRGCPFHNTNTEFPDPAHPGNREAVEHVREIHDQLTRIGRDAQADDPAALADELLLIIDGMYANAPILGARGPARVGVALAADRIRQRTTPKG
jgi:AcrR family transcriptional regulator